MVLFQPTPIDVLQRMVDAVEQVRQRLLRASLALQAAEVPYAIVGSSAVSAWVATMDQAAIRNTPDVDVLICRSDFDAAKSALETAGFIYRHTAAIDMFLDHPEAHPRNAVHLLFARERIQPIN